MITSAKEAVAADAAVGAEGAVAVEAAEAALVLLTPQDMVVINEYTVRSLSENIESE